MDDIPHNVKIDDLIKMTEENNISTLLSNVLSTDFSQFTEETGDSDSTVDAEHIGYSDITYDMDFTSDLEHIDNAEHTGGLEHIANATHTGDSELTVDAFGLAGSDENLNNIEDSQLFQYAHARTNITPQVIECLEDDLDFDDKVSLVFLLYDSDDLALQRLKISLRANQSGSIVQCGLLSDWAARESSSRWEDKFLEALCIIQNYKVVERLGYHVDDVKTRFLPHNRQSSLFVDLMRKALYHMCESLSVPQLDRLLELVQQDMEQQGRLKGGYDTMFMEMNILHWMSQRYLNVGLQGGCSDVNIKNLTKHLKVMGELQLVEYLESLARRCNRLDTTQRETEMESGSVSGYSDQMSMRSTTSSNSTFCHGPRSSHSLTSQCQEEKPANEFRNTYFVDPDNVGYCVIINQKIFYREPDPNYQSLLPEDILENRVGTDIDRDRLSEVFLNFGFAVRIWENLTHLELMQAIREASTSLVKKEHSCFVLCILSHGKKNAVYGANSISVDMDEIEKSIHGKYCPRLIHKPKILIIQACQGLQQQDALPSDIDTDGAIYSKTCPEVSDMITFWSTVPGYAAFRDRLTGSWFIKTLWNQLLLKQSIDVDMMSAFVSIIGQVCDKRAPIDGELKAMTPQFTTSFRKTLFFPYHREARKATAKRLLERYLFDYMVDKYLRIICQRHVGAKPKKLAHWLFNRK